MENNHVTNHRRNDHTGKVHKGEPHKLLDLLNGVLDHLKGICSYLGVTAGGVTMQVKCSKEESHISNHRRNDHTGRVHKGEPHKLLDLLSGVLEYLNGIC